MGTVFITRRCVGFGWRIKGDAEMEEGGASTRDVFSLQDLGDHFRLGWRSCGFVV